MKKRTDDPVTITLEAFRANGDPVIVITEV